MLLATINSGTLIIALPDLERALHTSLLGLVWVILAYMIASTVLVALADDAELITCIAGEGAPLDAEAVGALAPAGVELELEEGGQPAYWWLLSAE